MPSSGIVSYSSMILRTLPFLSYSVWFSKSLSLLRKNDPWATEVIFYIKIWLGCQKQQFKLPHFYQIVFLQYQCINNEIHRSIWPGKFIAAIKNRKPFFIDSWKNNICKIPLHSGYIVYHPIIRFFHCFLRTPAISIV